MAKHAFCLLFLAIIVSGCMTYGGSPAPVDPNFTPTRTYSLDYNTAWSDMITTLHNSRVAITSSDKAQGQILTDYIAGQGTSGQLALGGMSANQWRIKFNIFFDTRTPGKVSITVSPVIEVMTTVVGAYSGNSTVIPYTDATRENPALAQSQTKALFAEFDKVVPPG